jgi:hypothetical protein
MQARFILVALVLSAGCYKLSFDNGKLLCSSPDRQCPGGYHCAFDGKCWKEGSDPVANKNPGDACGPDDVCSTGNCVDGFCCDTACDGPCETCEATPGTCTIVTGTPQGARACAGQGTSCLGVCDGTAKDCAYPPSGTICGAACDGKCNGAGACSSQAGGACPGGFACSASGCLTSCSKDADCQTNFTCAGSSCMRVAESDCLDGKDNNGDGLADCADPTCTAQVTCVPIGPGGSQLGVVNANCPTGFGPGTTEMTNFSDTTCGGCTCKTIPVCAVEADVHPNGGCGGGGPNVFPTGGADGATKSACAPITAASFINVYIFAPALQSRNCAVGGTPTRADPSFAVTTKFCPASRTSPTCADSAHVCVPAAPPSSSVCVSISGHTTCPTGYQTNPPTYYYQGASKGTCGTCPASCTGNGVGCSGNVDVYAYSGACSGTIYGPCGPNKCCSMSSGASVTLGGLNAVFYPDGATDTCTVGQPTAQPSTLIGESTICCQ